MARRVHNVQSVVPINHTCTFSQNGNATFLFESVAVHGSFGVELNSSLLEQAVDQRGLAVIYVSDNCNVTSQSNVVVL